LFIKSGFISASKKALDRHVFHVAEPTRVLLQIEHAVNALHGQGNVALLIFVNFAIANVLISNN